VDTVVIGVGNPYRSDDGVGPAVVALLRSRDLPGVRLAESTGETGHLLDLWSGAALAIVVDAVRTADPHPGRVHRLSLTGTPDTGAPRTASSHGLRLGEAVELARALDRLPDRLLLYAVEIADSSYGTTLSAPLAAAVPDLATAIATLITEPVVTHPAAPPPPQPAPPPP
jgi:hydrogenase maturation protease